MKLRIPHKAFPISVFVQAICFVGIIIVTVSFFLSRYHMGQVRYFDMDELAYLSWASDLVMGRVPYRDFLFGVIPGFLWILKPIIGSASGIQIFLVSRAYMFWMFTGTTIVLAVVFWQMRRSWLAIMVPLFLVWIAIPSDKFLEIRPDTLSFGLAWLAIALCIAWTKKKQPILLVIAGCVAAYSAVIFPKSFFQIGICYGMVLSFGWKDSVVTTVKRTIPFVIGACIVVIGVLCWMATTGSLSLALYSVTRMVTEMSQIGALFPIPPQYFFWPSDVYYGIGGIHIGYVYTQCVWVFGAILATFYPFAAWAEKDKRKQIIMFGIAASFFLNLYFFVSMTPLKHEQYLISIIFPLVLIVVDYLERIRLSATRTVGDMMLFCIGLGILVYLMLPSFSRVNEPKMYFSNRDLLNRYVTIQTVIPKTEPILDLVGLTINYPRPFYVQNIPFGQFAAFLSRPLPSLISALETHDVKFIYQGDAKRIITLSPEDQLYVSDHFTPILRGDILVRNDVIGEYSIPLQ